MLEGLKNADPTFCKMMKTILKDEIGRNVFTYVNDIIVSNKKKCTHIKDLVETFANMRGAQFYVTRRNVYSASTREKC
jgi:hypothetical protein